MRLQWQRTFFAGILIPLPMGARMPLTCAASGKTKDTNPIYFPALSRVALIYSTCSYSMEEDESHSRLAHQRSGFCIQVITNGPGWNLVESFSPERQAACYRFYPDKLEGEGFYGGVFKTGEMRKPGNKIRNKQDKHKMSVIPEREKEYFEWIKPMQGISWMAWQESVLLFPERWMPELLSLQSHLYIRRASINIGTRVREEFIPDHQLAMSDFLDADIPAMELDRGAALQYLPVRSLARHQFTRMGFTDYQGLALGGSKIPTGSIIIIRKTGAFLTSRKVGRQYNSPYFVREF